MRDTISMLQAFWDLVIKLNMFDLVNSDLDHTSVFVYNKGQSE